MGKIHLPKVGNFQLPLTTPEEIAKKLKIKAKTVREWLKAGKLKGYKFGTIWRIKKEDFDEFIANSRHER